MSRRTDPGLGALDERPQLLPVAVVAQLGVDLAVLERAGDVPRRVDVSRTRLLVEIATDGGVSTGGNSDNHQFPPATNRPTARQSPVKGQRRLDAVTVLT